ncbi:MAG: hypothetical protein CMD18_05415 [Flavobacteriales bacterium]|nr:hypothetical protein [Flavobacteriales bacterium]|tara:strand:- start:454 stop:669 length:216 start_codon:yes stop_codon:yes gene_type:complete
MEGGIATGNLGQITDPDFRFEIYLDWKSVRKRYPNYDVQQFARNKGIAFERLGEIVREYDSYDPTGERWPV